MKRRITALLLGLMLAACISACGGDAAHQPAMATDAPPATAEPSAPPASPTETEVSPTPIQEVHDMKLTLNIGGQTFTATLLDDETSRAFAAQLPLTLDMTELNGNEKYFYLDSSLPTNAANPGQINAGDLMLYGDNCLVLFYESFSTSYRYTRLGQLDDLTGLATALGQGSVQVTFSMG